METVQRKESAMNAAKLSWKVVRVSSDLLENTLNELSEAKFEVFSVQMEPQTEGEEWAIIARTVQEGSKETDIGFRGRRS
jgi:hypothetical protein